MGYKTEPPRHGQEYNGYQREERREVVKVKEAKYMVTEDDVSWVLGTQYNMQIMCHRSVRLKPI